MTVRIRKGNNIYIKKAGENGLISFNPNCPPLTADRDRIIALEKVLEKAAELRFKLIVAP